jgi:hypothetical protein
MADAARGKSPSGLPHSTAHPRTTRKYDGRCRGHKLAVQLAAIPNQIRGFGHIKEKNLALAKVNEADLLKAFHTEPNKFATAAE